MEVASTREYSTIRRGLLYTAAIFDDLRLDGERKYHEFHEGRS